MGDVACTDLQDRYAAVERLYGQGQWSQVLDACAALLAELPAEPADPLRIRLTLLQGHTQLYGFGQVQAAAALYQQVLDSQPEPLLQTIALQELERCRQQQAIADQPPTPTADAQSMAPQGEATVNNAFPFAPMAVGSAAAPQTVSAMPWLEQLGGVDPAASRPQPSVEESQIFATTVEATAAHDNADARVPAADPAAEVVADPAPQPEVMADPSEAPAAPIVADVIEEPDQFEVHQADPERAETVDLTPLAELGSEDDQQDSAPTPGWSPEQEAEWAKGLLRVVLR
ncbi:MAG: hypothetical protein FJ077_07170 [Cyanobacteria bacterium K_DeepCast_35m_m2_023]|nr:hypothetical protein [Cyanobacteria bacterium K_DeepCast_35m_m2_023]